MRNKYVVIRLSILLVLVAMLVGLLVQSITDASAGPPVPTPTPEKTWRQLEAEVLEKTQPVLEHEASVSGVESTCISASAQEAFYSVADAEIRQGYSGTNYGSSTIMRCGYDEDYYNPNGQIMRCLMKFDISSLPAGATINSAKLYVGFAQSWDFPGQIRTYTAYRIPSNWSENTVTWNTAPAPAEAYGSTGVPHEGSGWYTIDVTNLIRFWNNGTYSNYGIMLRGPEWSGYDSSWKGFYTKESSADPYLVVDYDYIPPTLGASPTLLRFEVYDTGPSPEPQAITIRNITAGSLNWSAAKVDGASWLGLDTTSGTVTPSSPDIMNVSVDTTGLTYGTHSERIALTKTTAVTECSNRTIDVVLEYEALPTQEIYLPIISKSGSGSAPSRDAVALVIGIAQYPYLSQIADIRAGGGDGQLQFTDDDARDIRDRLYQANFSSNKVLTLIDSAATKASINNAFNQLANMVVNPQTLVVISFSGHGAQILDVPPYDETDGYDEVILPQDATLTGGNLITDDELDQWLTRLGSEHIVVTIDSCHSGGMIDMSGISAGRGINFVLNRQDVIAQVAEADGLTADISKDGRVILASDRTDQISWEFGALQNGVFSYYFVEGLSSTIADGDGNGQISAEEAFSYLECRVDNYTYGHTGGAQGGPYHQTPQLYDGTIGEEWISQP